MQMNIRNVTAAIDFIEGNLTGELDLGIVAHALHYSKYHLHRVFTDTVGLTIHDYVRRRRLTEAARLLVFSDRPIIEIALAAGYGSQQAFSGIFKPMYKKTPNRYREVGEFYPLQLRYMLDAWPEGPGAADWQADIVPAAKGDIPAWMDLLRLVVDGFPHLDEEEHVARLRQSIGRGQAMVVRDAGAIVGAMVFDGETGNIDFLGIHPLYRRRGIAKAFLRRAQRGLWHDSPISITTFRAGDKADPGYRDTFRRLGFVEAELLVEFGYPTQKLILQKRGDGGGRP